ncbi:histidine phosphatase family protein [Nonomuraea glycinis]|uniref:Phosphoglycerate mutase n=1 Tax=Nonomuraea glycinis TaxID=2047744 RepID=A0A918E4V4_9ACTN|nr:histidine phosphatase family protein [Nonomuraea glycinis]MCA2177820.1 histidine phosphatase family protein [Nonomuraea glycinis]GGP06622.1 phosphoglycerate mutase [Nonomuraea glycinis]
MAPRYLYLVRHGEALPDESGLSADGHHQAELLGRRLRDVPFAAVHHGPLPRAAQTARLIAAELDCPDVRVSDAAGDFIPYVPAPEELPPEATGHLTGFLSHFGPEDRDRGRALAQEALDRFTGPVAGERDRHELVVTHNFLIGWLVRDAYSAPPWRWLGINQANAALTVIRYAPDRLPAVLVHNDMSHLPAALRWTGFPPELRA